MLKYANIFAKKITFVCHLFYHIGRQAPNYIHVVPLYSVKLGVLTNKDESNMKGHDQD